MWYMVHIVYLYRGPLQFPFALWENSEPPRLIVAADRDLSNIENRIVGLELWRLRQLAMPYDPLEA